MDKLVSTTPTPDQTAQSDQDRQQLQQALAELTGEQRLIVQLRYQQGMTLGKISEIMQLGDPFRANRRLKAALAALSKALEARNFNKSRK